ncbi:hypothetical protein [Clostridium sp. MD294]|uniref:hypothetical protein n=1 Tax=Clostridium sp. MD294 TaxID=97138 RepID=UPI0002CB3906|nr:hypothetical protein [Clostridium sp. MD294]NDO47587.1 hypothetical protein [Clostridium sp. MD294]USF29339.1 hypothetical protein C820_000729 [Clostridium sp. MD294]
MNNVNMNVKVNASVYASSTVAQHQSTTVKEAGKETTTSSTQVKQDTFVFSGSVSASTSKNNAIEENKNTTYEKPNKLSAQQLQALSDQRVASFKNMVQTMLGKQVKTLNKSLFEGITISPADKQAAIDAISPGGAWSPENVAGNILNMAKALSGGDASKIETLKNAVIKGFQAAEKEWGGKLPSITDETYDLIMKGFDEWANEGKETNSTDDSVKTEKAEA